MKSYFGQKRVFESKITFDGILWLTMHKKWILIYWSYISVKKEFSSLKSHVWWNFIVYYTQCWVYGSYGKTRFISCIFSAPGDTMALVSSRCTTHTSSYILFPIFPMCAECTYRMTKFGMCSHHYVLQCITWYIIIKLIMVQIKYINEYW